MIRKVDSAHLEVLVGRVLSHPVRVEHTQTLESTANPLLGDGLEVPLRLLLVHRSGSLGLTWGATAISLMKFSEVSSYQCRMSYRMGSPWLQASCDLHDAWRYGR